MSSTLYYPVSKEALLPCEELLEIERSKRQLHIGVLAETDPYEYRVALTPETVGVLVRNGHIVTIEKQAGAGANYERLFLWAENNGFRLLNFCLYKRNVINIDIARSFAPNER